MCHAFPGKGVRLQSAMPLNFEQLFNFLFCAKVLIPLESEQDGPGLQFGSDTRGHRDCLNLNTGQLEPSSRCLFLNRVAVSHHIAAPQLCFDAKPGYHEIQMAARPDGMAGAGGGAGPAQDVRHQRPGETSSRVY